MDLVRRLPAIALLVAVLAGVPAAWARRAPTAAERRAIVAALLSDTDSPAMGEQRPPASCWSIHVSTVNPRYASGLLLKKRGCGPLASGGWLWVLHRTGSGWEDAYLGDGPPCWREVPKGPAAAVKDLFGNAGCG
jgi:hypothetical protein